MLETILSFVHVILNIEWIVFVKLFEILIWNVVRWKIFFLITKFQSKGLPHNHGLLLLKNTFKFHVFFKNENIEFFINKYLLIDQTMFSMKICNMQIHHYKKIREKNVNQFTDFNI